MNTLHKLLKITCAICLSCVCSTSKAEPKILTLEELRMFLEQQCAEDTKRLEAIRDKVKTGNQKGFAPTHNKANNSYSCNIPKEFSENFKGITHVEYNAEGEPTVIETVNGWRPEVSGILQFIPREDAPFRQHIREKFSNTTSAACLDKISKELTAKELEARGVTDDDMKKYEIASVREITFDSILKSDFFDDTRRAKGGLCFENRKELEKCIDAYVNKAVFLQFITYRRKNTRIDLVTETSPNNSTFKIREEAQQPNEDERDFVYKVSGEWREKMKAILANGLKNLLRYKNGKEKVILLLLLDEKTPPEFQLKWVCESDNYGEYNSHKNWILSNFETSGFAVLSHEIGHYLQTHLGLHQDLKTNDEFLSLFKDYQMKFAKELLLTGPTRPKTNTEIHIPGGLLSDIAFFYGNPHFTSNIPFDRFSEKDLFVHWQLASRWHDNYEISNILGVYFDAAAEIIYIHTLSDIREFQSVIFYGHEVYGEQYEYLKNQNGEYWQEFETTEAQSAFESIVAEAAEQKPSVEVLKLLCKLHKRPGDENKVINVFDYKNKESFCAQCLPYLQNFKAADE